MSGLPASTRVRPAEEVLFRNLDGEAVLVHLQDGVYFGLDEIGTRIWEWMGDGATLDALLEQVLAHYEVSREQAAADLDELVRQLLDAHLVVAGA